MKNAWTIESFTVLLHTERNLLQLERVKMSVN